MSRKRLISEELLMQLASNNSFSEELIKKEYPELFIDFPKLETKNIDYFALRIEFAKSSLAGMDLNPGRMPKSSIPNRAFSIADSMIKFIQDE